MLKVVYRTEVFADGRCYVGVCPELNVTSFGDTPEDARDSLKEAVDAFFEGCKLLGTLEETLEESGFERNGDAWRLRRRVIESEARTAIPLD